MLQRLAESVCECEEDDDVRAILLESANQAPPFAGDGEALIADPSWDAQFTGVREGQRALSRIEFSTKPVVMAIYDGVCMGGGLELALSCHVRVAGEATVFSVPEARAGGMPGWGNTQRLVKYFGRAKAIELALTGSQITAAEALALGAVNHVVPGGDVLSKAREITEAIAGMRTKSISAIITAMNVPYRIGLAEGYAVEHERYMEIYDPDTFVEAIRALFDGRTVEFSD
jgi:enoyl-CoA hydratase/carnithine racemase